MSAQTADAGEEFVLLAIPDMNGSMRGKALRPDAFESALEHGTVMTDLIIGLDPVDAPIADYERFGIRAGAPDLIVRPDPDTLQDLRWRPGWQVCLATPSWPDGSPAFASREVFRRVLEDVDGLGFEVMAAIEYEIRIWDEQGAPASSGISYSLNEIGRYGRFLDELVPALEGLGIELSAVHTEAGPGLLELNVEARRGLAAADDAALLKFGVKQVAASMGLRASFLAKTSPGEEGSSGHVHLSLWRGGTNAFAGADLSAELAPPFSSAVAGVIEHLPAASLLLNPTINSYKRLVPGWFAPINATWGYREPLVRRPRDPLRASRAVAIRVPQARRRREPVPGARRDRGLRRGRDQGRGFAAPADHGRRVRARPAGAAGLARGGAPRVRGGRCAPRGARQGLQRLLRHLEGVGAEGLARDRHRVGA